MNPTKKKLEYKWVILVACFVMTFMALGFCSGNKGLYLSAITDALHIPRSLFSINDSFRYVSSAVISVFFGRLLHKYGVRKMVAFGFVCLIGSLLLYAYANTLPMFYLGGILLGVGLAFTSGSMTSSIIRRWFKKDIGKYIGIVYAANGVGGALAAQIVSPMINREGDAFGYRDAYLTVAAIVFVVGVVVILALRERPKNETIEKVDLKSKKSRSAAWVGVEYHKAIKMPIFFVGGIVVFLTGFMLQGINTVYAAYLKDIKIDAAFIATVASVFSLALTVTKILVGAIYDRFGLRTVMLVCQLAGATAFIILLLVGPSLAGMALTIVFALLYALSLPLETLVVPLIVNDLFGNASYDKILGMYIAMNYSGYALGAPLINLCFDMFGSYKPAFVGYAALMVVSCVVFMLVINTATKQKEAIISNQN